MSTETVLSRLRADGLALEVTGANLKVWPRSRLTDEHRTLILSQKSALLLLLSGRRPRPLPAKAREAVREAIEERAAIQEFDGGMSRSEAESAARAAMRVYEYRVTDSPGSWLLLIAPRRELDEARRIVEGRFGAKRIIDVRECAWAKKG